MSDMVKYRAAIWSFLKLTALYFTMSDIVHQTVPIFKISASVSLLCHEHGSFLIASFYFLAILIVQNFKITG